jgi:hypothetical protein
MSSTTELKRQVLIDRYISETKFIDLLNELFGEGGYQAEVSTSQCLKHYLFSLPHSLVKIDGDSYILHVTDPLTEVEYSQEWTARLNTNHKRIATTR